MLDGVRVEECAVNECARSPDVPGQPRHSHERRLTPWASVRALLVHAVGNAGVQVNRVRG
jgi:hypothetical protein